jgi:hypothetical protein
MWEKEEPKGVIILSAEGEVLGMFERLQILGLGRRNLRGTEVDGNIMRIEWEEEECKEQGVIVIEDDDDDDDVIVIKDDDEIEEDELIADEVRRKEDTERMRIQREEKEEEYLGFPDGVRFKFKELDFLYDFMYK